MGRVAGENLRDYIWILVHSNHLGISANTRATRRRNRYSVASDILPGLPATQQPGNRLSPFIFDLQGRSIDAIIEMSRTVKR
jgi:hypothetical protein